MSATKTPCRLRKVQCGDCGYVARITRSWLEVGLPGCPCGGKLEPTEPADQAFVGMVGPDDMPGSAWTAICRANGWDGAIARKGAAQLAHVRKTGGSIMYEPRSSASHCVFAGCGRWVKDGADVCSAGHAQHEHAVKVDITPF